MKKLFLLGLIAILGLLSIPSTQILAQVPKLLNFSGNLWDNTQNPPVPVNAVGQPVFVEIFDQPTGGVAIWSDQFQVDVVNGYFSVNLGSGTEALDLAFDKPYYVQVKIGNNGTPTARVPLTSSAYALNADKAAYALEVADGSVTQAKLAPGIQALPIGPAGGDLMGTYPNPQIDPDKILESIEPGSITQDKLAPNVTTPPSGPASGDLTGSYPDPLIAPGAVRTDRIADGAVISQKIASRTILNGNIALHQITDDLMDNTDDFNFNSVTTATTVDVGTDLTVNGMSTLQGATTANNTLVVNGSSTFNNDVQVTGNTTINSDLTVDGVTTLNDMLTVTANGADITGDVMLNNNLNVTGASTFTDAVTANNGVTITNGLTADTGMITSATATNLTGTNVMYTSGTLTNVTGTGLNYTNATIGTGAVTNISGTNLSYTNGTFTNMTITNLTVTNLTATDGTFSNNLTVGNNLTVNGNIIGKLNNNLTQGDGIIPFTYNNSAAATVGIADLGVTTAKINNLAVTNGKLADDAVTEPKILASNAATTGYVLGYNGTNLEWKPGTVLTSGLITGSGTLTDEIRLDASQGAANEVIIKNAGGTAWTTSTINGGVIADESITSNDIQNNTIMNADINAAAAIDYSKLNLASKIVSGDIVDGTIATVDIGNAQVTAAKISSTGVGAGNVLISDGAGSATWSNDPLALDYAGTYAGTNDAFSITHTGTTGKVMNLSKTNAGNTSAVLALQGNNLLFDATGTSSASSYTAQIKNTTVNGRGLLIEGNSVNSTGQNDAADADNAVLVVRNTSAGNPGFPIAGAEGKTAIKTYGDIWANSAIGGNTIIGLDRIIIGTGPTSVTMTPPANVGDPLNFSDDVEIGSSTTSADLKVWGNVWAQGTVTGSSISFTSATFNNINITNTLGVGGVTTLAGALNANAGLTTNAATITTADINGGTIDGVAINASTIGGTTAAAASFTTLNASNATMLGSSLNVTGATTLAGLTASSSSVTGNSTIDGDLVVDDNFSFTGGQTVNEIVTTITNASTDNQLPTAKATWNLVNSITADNGLTNNSGTMELGGTLNKNTNVMNGGFDLTIGSTTFMNSGNVSTAGNLATTGTLKVDGASTLAGLTATSGSFGSTLEVDGTTQLDGATTINNTLGVTGATTLAGLTGTSASFGSTLEVDGTTQLDGGTTINNTLGVTGATTLAGLTATSASVTGNSTLNGDVNVGGNFNFDAGQTVNEIVTTISGTSTHNQLPTAKAAWDLVDNLTAINGITENSGTFKLGGALTESTTITTTGPNDLVLIGGGELSLYNGEGLYVDSGVLTVGSSSNASSAEFVGGTVSFTGTGISQTGTSQVTFGGNVDAQNGLDVTGALLTASNGLTANAATLTTADINGGTIDATTIGGTTAAAASFTTLNASGATTLASTLNVTGNTTLGNVTASAATLTTADINGGTIDAVAINGSTIGGTTAAAASFTTLNASANTTLMNVTAADGTLTNLTVTGATTLGNTTASAATLTTADINGGTIDATTIGGTTAAAASFTTLNASANTTLMNVTAADGTLTNLTVTGATTLGNVTASAATLTTADINGGTIDATTIGGSTAAAASFTNVNATGTLNFDAGQSVDEIVTAVSSTSTNMQLPTAKATWDLVNNIPVKNGLTNSSGTIMLGGNLTQNTTVTNNGFSLTVDGSAGDVVVSSTGVLSAGNGLDVTTANLTVGGTKFIVDQSNGNISSDGTLNVKGDATLGDAATTDQVIINASMDIKNSITNTSSNNGGRVNISDADGLSVTGDYFSTGGDIELTNGNITLTNGNITTSDGNVTVGGTGNLNVTGTGGIQNSSVTQPVLVSDTDGLDIRGNLTNGSSSLTLLDNDGIKLTSTSGVAVTGPLTASSTLAVTGNATFNGNVTLGDAAGDVITSTGAFTASNGATVNNAVLDVNAGLTANAATLTTADIDGGTIDATTIGGSTAAAASFTTLNVSGNSTLANVTATAATLTTADINGGTIDATTIGGSTAAAASFTNVNATGTLNFDAGQSVDEISTTISAASTNSQLPTAKAVWDLAISVPAANNGLTNNSNTFQLGGNLNQNTTVTNNGFSLTFDGSANDVVIASNGGLTAGAATLTTAEINGGNITGVTNVSGTNGTFTNLNNTTIGNTTAAAASFTTINASGNTTLANVTATAATLTTAEINGGNITGVTNVSGTNGTFTNLNNTTIGNTTAAAASFTTINASGNLTGNAATFTTLSLSGGSLTGLTNVSATNGTFTNLNNTTIGNTTAAAATFTTLNTTGATTLGSTLAVTSTATFSGSSTFTSDVTLGDAAGDAISSNGIFTATNGLIVSGGTANKYISGSDITGANIGIALTSGTTANAHNSSFIQLSDGAANSDATTGFAIEASALNRPYGFNIKTSQSPTASGAGNSVANALYANTSDAADIALDIDAGAGGDGDGIALNIQETSGATSSSFTAIKVNAGKLVWSNKSYTPANNAAVDLSADGYYTVFFIDSDGTNAVTLPNAEVTGQIIYVFNTDGASTLVMPGTLANINAGKSATYIYNGTTWLEIDND